MDKNIPLVQETPLFWKSKCGEYKVTITRSCLLRMVRVAEKSYPKEAGTSLYGSYSEDGYEASILGTAPETKDSHGTATTFYRGVVGIQQYFLTLWKYFRGKRFYVGEWHSHPHGSPYPSNIDDKNMIEIAGNSNTNCPEAILVILGSSLSKTPQLSVFIYSRKGGKVELIREAK